MPIITNLMVRDIDASLEFWRDLLGFDLKFAVDAAKTVATDGTATGAVFVALEWEGAELMLQAGSSLRGELPGVMAEAPFAPAATLYLRGYDPAKVLDRLSPAQIVKGPFRQWYGMTELYLRDPDGHVVCLGIAEGPPPA